MFNRFFNASLTMIVIVTVAWSSAADARRGRGRGKAAAAASGSADCKVDSDCALVTDDCCSCRQGGKQRAIPKKDKAKYEKERKKRCDGTMCTEMMSEDPSCTQVPFCGAGICELGAPPEKSPK